MSKKYMIAMFFIGIVWGWGLIAIIEVYKLERIE